MMRRIAKKIAGAQDKDGLTLAEFWREMPRWHRWTLIVAIPAAIAWMIFQSSGGR